MCCCVITKYVGGSFEQRIHYGDFFIRDGGVSFRYSAPRLKSCSSSAVNGIRVAKSLHSLLKMNPLPNSSFRWISSSRVRGEITVTLRAPIQRACRKAGSAAQGEITLCCCAARNTNEWGCWRRRCSSWSHSWLAIKYYLPREQGLLRRTFRTGFWFFFLIKSLKSTWLNASSVWKVLLV